VGSSCGRYLIKYHGILADPFPAFFFPYVFLAKLAALMGLRKKALVSLKKALEIKPETPMPWNF
jgi:hypothetical protein